MSLTPLAGMRCQLCQKPISLLRRLSDPDFCSAAHREQYDQQQAALAIARLQPVVRQANGRGRAATVQQAAVAVLEPEQPPRAVELAGIMPCPPKQARQYWSFALPAEPIPPPVGVMLRDDRTPWPILTPAWATSVVAMWPVNRQSRTALEQPVAPAQVHFALPASPLHPLPWIERGAQAIPDALKALIPLSVLPAWSLPHRYLGEAAAGVFRASLCHPGASISECHGLAAAPALAWAPLKAAAPQLSFFASSVEAVSLGSPSPWIWTGAIPFGVDTPQQERESYLRRMERQLVQLAEQAGLCGQVLLSLPSGVVSPPKLRGAAGESAFESCRTLPRAAGAFAVAEVSAASIVPVSGPARQASASAPHPGDQAPLASPPALCWPAPPAQPVRSLPASDRLPWVAVPDLAGAVHPAPSVAEPAHGITYCWPAVSLISPALSRSDRLAKPPEPTAKLEPRAAQESTVMASMAVVSVLLPAADLTVNAPALSSPSSPALFSLAPPPPKAFAGHVGAEPTPHPGRPSVIVPASAGAALTRASSRQQTLFPLTHLFPTRRDQVARNLHLDVCQWRGKPVLPATRLPRVSLQERNATRASALKEVRQVLQKQTIDRARRFWKLAPADLKWLALALPLILGAWLWPKKPVSVSVPSPVGFVKTQAKAAAGSSYLEKAFQSNLNFGGFEERIAQRSSIHLEEDFSAGLSLWEGDGNWARSWYYDKSGVVRPGRMAIYQPSIPMVDYELVLTAAVERRSISWMVRATNLRNYIAARLNIAGSGSGQRLSFERWTVKDGRVTRRQVLPLGTTLGTATTARIRMEVVGNTFTTMLQDQVIDVFSDSSHASGGVGLFSSDGDQPRIYRLELTHQHDFFGKLCSFLAPHPITKAGTIRP